MGGKQSSESIDERGNNSSSNVSAVQDSTALDDLLVCQLCKEEFNLQIRIGKFLDCHHTFCLPCLRQFTGKEIICPYKCRQRTNIQGRTVDELATNMYIRPTIERRMLGNFKITFLGERFVGKTSILKRFINDSFDEYYQATIGIDIMSKDITLRDRTMSLNLWDTTGQERFQRSFPNSYIRNSAVVLVVYDITKQETFYEVDKWVGYARDECDDSVIIILIGNKADLSEERKVSTACGKRKADELNILFDETSAKNGYNIKGLFSRVAAFLVNRESNQNDDVVQLNSIPTKNNTRTRKRCC